MFCKITTWITSHSTTFTMRQLYKIIFFATAFCLLLFPSLACSAAEEKTSAPVSKSAAMPTVAEIKAGMEANRAKFQSADVVFRLTNVRPDAYFKSIKKRMDHWQKILAESKDEKLKAELKHVLMAEEQQLNLIAEERYYLEYLTDGKGFQWRLPDHSWDEGIDWAHWKFPAEPLNRDTIAVTYKNCIIDSYAPGVEHGARSWHGKSQNAFIADESIDVVNGLYSVPPFLLKRSPSIWTDWLDEYLTFPLVDLKIADGGSLDGRTVLCVEHSDLKPMGPKTGFLATCKRQTLWKWWIDPAQGFLPVKAEKYFRIVSEDPQYSVPYDTAKETYSIPTIQKTANGGFYPMKIVRTLFEPDPDAVDDSFFMSVEESLKRAKTEKPIPHVPQGIHTLEVEKIDVGPIDPALFLLDFPPKTPYTDRTTGVNGLWGEKNEEALAEAAACKKFYENLNQKGLPALEASRWINSEPLRLADLKGKRIILQFWSLGCGPSVSEIPSWENDYGKGSLQNPGVIFISVHPYCDGKDLAELAEAVRKKEITFPVMIDARYPTEEEPGVTFANYGVSSYPTQIIIDEKGVVHLPERSLINAGDNWKKRLQKQEEEMK